MATRLDQRIEQLEIIVEECFDLCNVTCKRAPQQIPPGLSTDAKYAGRDRTVCRPGEPEQPEVRETCSR